MDQKSNKLLILDLDETLIHASEEKLPIVEDFKFDKYWVYKRPFVDSFLLDISQHFKIGIWSSADDAYVAGIIDSIKPEGVSFEIIWGKSRCSLCRDYEHDKYYFEKRLDKLKKKGFRKEQIIVVDDSPENQKTITVMLSILKNLLVIMRMKN